MGGRGHQAGGQVDRAAHHGELAATGRVADVAAVDAAGGEADGQPHRPLRQGAAGGQSELGGLEAVVLGGGAEEAEAGDGHAALVVHHELPQRPAAAAQHLQQGREDGLEPRQEAVAQIGLEAVQQQEGRGDLAHLREQAERLAVQRLQRGLGDERAQLPLVAAPLGLAQQLRRGLSVEFVEERPRRGGHGGRGVGQRGERPHV